MNVTDLQQASMRLARQRRPAPTLSFEREPWMGEALCAGILDDTLFFPEQGGDNGRGAKKVCARCPVKAECLAFALAHGEQHGVWGGLSPGERQRLKRGVA